MQLLTNKGPLAVEIQCDKVPKTGENFLELCENGYYKGTKFHRLISNFMVLIYKIYIFIMFVIVDIRR